MSGPGFAFKWNAVNPDVDWQLTQSKSYGDGIQTLNNAMNAFADSTRKQNTDALLMQIAQANDPTALGNTGILAGIDPLNRTVAGADVLKEFMTRDDALRTKQANTMATDFLLNNTSNLEFIKERSELEGITPEYMGPIASLVSQQRATAAAAAQQAAENKRKDIEVGLKVSKNNSDIEMNNTIIAEKLFKNQGTEKTDVLYDESGKAYPVTTRTPGMASLMANITQAESGGVHRQPDGSLTRSPAGALGKMQIMPATAAKPGYGMKPINLENSTPEEQEAWATEYIGRIGNHHKFSLPQAVAAYNAGPGKVQEAVSGKGDWYSKLPKETKDYVVKVLGSDWQSLTNTPMSSLTTSNKSGAIDAAVSGNTSGEVNNPFSPGSVAVPSSATTKGAKGQAPKFQPGVGFDGPSVLEAQSSMKAAVEAANAKNTLAKAKPSKVQESEFQQFLAKGGYTGNEILNRNAELYGTLKNFGEFNKMPGSEKKALLEYLTNENQKGWGLAGRLSAKEVKAKVERYKADRKYDAAATAKQESFAALNAAATKLYQANVKRFPNITMQQAREMVDKKIAADYAKLSKGG